MAITKEKFYGLKYDRIFKGVFIDEVNKDYSLLEELIKECLDTDVKIVKLLVPELNVRSKDERTKRVDCLVEAKGKYINIEINIVFDAITKVRNLNFFTSFYSQHTKIGEEYDIDSEFIHISLNFDGGDNKPLKKTYQLYDKEHEDMFVETFKIIEVNVDSYRKFWYDKDELAISKSPLLVMLNLEREEMEKYTNEYENENAKRVQAELERINQMQDFLNNFDYEWADRAEINTRMRVTAKEAKGEGIKERNLEIAKNMLNREFDLNTISDITGLSIRELEKLQ